MLNGRSSSTRPARGRDGFTLAELLVAMAVAGIVLGILTAVSVREQRAFADLTEQAVVAAQLREAAAVLPVDLRALSPAAGDIRDARDTAIEVRATIASAVACDTVTGAIVLAPARTDAASYASSFASVSAGDTAWLLTPADSDDAWAPYAVASVAASAAGQCAPGGPQLDAAAAAAPRTKIALVGVAPAARAAFAGVPLRITRPVRYSVYKASDGDWYLGERDWNAASLRFNIVQPVAGPMRPAAAGGLTFTFRDSAGASLTVPAGDLRLSRRIDIDLRAQTKHGTRSLRGATAGSSAPHVDSAHVVLTLRNR